MDSLQFPTKGYQKMSASPRPMKFEICDSTLAVDEPIDEPITEKRGKYISYCSYNYKIIWVTDTM